MTDVKFINFVKNEVADYTNKHLDKTDGKQITPDDVFIVWICKTLQNNKALASTTLFDGMYYEITYNGDKEEFYIDAYKKWENYCVKLESVKDEDQMKQFNCPDCTKYTNDCYADCERTRKEKYFMVPKPSDIGFESHPCTKCPNNPINGGSGICNCTLGQPKIT